MTKLKSTYTDKLPRMVNPRTGRVHTNYGQAMAVTGRLSSTDPNLQNIPVRTAEGRRIREAFIAPPGVAHRVGRLFADRAAHHGAPVGRRIAAQGLRRRRGRAPRDRGRSLRRAARPGQLGAAPLRQGDQLRPDLRHVGVRARVAARHRALGRAAVHGALLRALSRAWPTTCSAPAMRRAISATSKRCSAAGCTCPRSGRRTRAAARARSARRSMRRCRAPRPISSSSR